MKQGMGFQKIWVSHPPPSTAQAWSQLWALRLPLRGLVGIALELVRLQGFCGVSVMFLRLGEDLGRNPCAAGT